MNGRVKILKPSAFSDGDPTHVPDNPQYKLIRPCNLYLDKLGAAYAAHIGQNTSAGVRYSLDALPTGYDVYEERRANGGQSDRWLYGCSNRRTFDSPNRFIPHFLHVIDQQGSSLGCPCTVCIGTAGRGASTMLANPSVKRSHDGLPVIQRRLHGHVSAGSSGDSSRSSSRPALPDIKRGPGRPPGLKPVKVQKLDEEGIPDVYRGLIDRLKTAQSLDVPIEEPMCMDWRVEHEDLSKQLAAAQTRPPWLPRLGEVVLFTRSMPQHPAAIDSQNAGLAQYRNTGRVGDSLKASRWEAGIVTQISEANLRLSDLVAETHRADQLNYSGFRIEPLPDLNSQDKSLSKQYKYVPLSHIRPFLLWKKVLAESGNATRVDLRAHSPTIKNALCAMRSVSLVDKRRFKGTWPEASISCSAVYIGSDLVLVGDHVALLTGTGQPFTEALLVESVDLRLFRLDEASDNDNDTGHPYNSAVHISGTLYTDELNVEGLSLLSEFDVPEILGSTSERPWRLKHLPGQRTLIPFSRIAGRLHGSVALRSWFPDEDIGPEIYSRCAHSARGVATTNDRRITEGKTWYWADSRADALDLHTLNGEEVAKHDQERKEDIEDMRNLTKYLDGHYSTQEEQAAQVKADSINYKAVQKLRRNNNMMVAAAMGAEAGNALSNNVYAGESSEEQADESDDNSADGSLGSGDHDVMPSSRLQAMKRSKNVMVMLGGRSSAGTAEAQTKAYAGKARRAELDADPMPIKDEIQDSDDY